MTGLRKVLGDAESVTGVSHGTTVATNRLLEGKVAGVDAVGLYLVPPQSAIGLSIDEKSQIQALDRTQKMLPMQPGSPE